MSDREAWARGELYEPYVGRWSRRTALEFVRWLDLPDGLRWLDVGCGTGALTGVVLRETSPAAVTGIDPSPGYIAYAQETTKDDRVRFEVGDAAKLPFPDSSFDVVVSGLVLNFIPEPLEAVAEMAHVADVSGTMAAYVWDYAGEMQLMRHFWDAAVALDPGATRLDEGRRFPICQPGPLTDLFTSAGLRGVEVRAIDIPTVFHSFDDYWSPFLGGQGPAPGYVMSLAEQDRVALREHVRATLPFAQDGSIPLIARAWAVQGRR